MKTKWTPLKGVARIGALGLLYVGASCIGLWFAFDRSNASPVWPAAGVAMAGLILLGWRAWPGIWLGAFTANVVVFLSIHVAHPGTIVWVSAVIACGNTLEAAIGWLFWQRWHESEDRELRGGPILPNVSVFEFAAMALLMSLVSACIGPTVVCAAGLMSWFHYQLIWLIWWFGDASGVLLVTPFVLAWARPDSIWEKRALLGHLAGAFTLLALTCWVVFARSEGHCLAYLAIVPLVWIASRLGPRALTSALILLSAVVTWFTLHGSGPFVYPTQHQSILFVLLFLWVVAITSLALQTESLKQAHSAETARRNETRFRLAIDYFPGPFVIYNAEKRVEFVNTGAAEANNLPEREWLGHTNEELFEPQFREQYLPALNRCVEERKPQTIDAVITLPVGGKRALLINFVPLLDQRGQILQILGIGYDITERKRAEAALRQSEARFETFMRHLPGFAFMKDRESRYIFLSEQAEDVFGRKASECLGKTDHEIWIPPVPEAADVCRRNDQIVLSTGLPLQTIELFPHEGEFRHWLVHKFPIIEEAGRLEIVAGVAVDVTDLKRAELAKKESDERLRSMSESTADAIITADFEGRIVSWNQGAKIMFGFDEGEILGTPIQLLMPERYRKAQEQDLEHFKHTGEGRVIDNRPAGWRGRRKDGSEFPMDISLSTWKVGGKRFFSGIIRDTTERERAQEALRQIEQRLQLVLQATTITVFTQGTDLRFTWIYNPQLGFSAEEVVGKTVEELLGESNAREFNELGRQVLETGTGTRQEVRMIMPEETRWFDVFIEPIRDSRDQIVGVAGVAPDITTQKAVQERLEAAQQRLKAALRQEEVLRREIHHRVKNNLQVISSLLYLQSTNVTDPKTREVLRESQVRARAIALIHELLYQRSDLTKIDFADYVRQLSEILFSVYEARARNASVIIRAEAIALDLDTAIPCGLIITELVSNAIKHAFPNGRKGEILIDLHRIEDGRLRLLFHDNGLGFPDPSNLETGRTMGIRLVSDLSQQLGGTAAFRNEQGAMVEIIFADPELCGH